MEFTYFSYITIATIAVYFFTSFVRRKRPKTPPIPDPCHPVMGHLNILSYPYTSTYTHLANRFGPVLTLWLGWQRVVLVSSISAAEECLTKNDIVFCNRPRSMLGKYVGYEFGSLNFAPYGSHWRNLRKISTVELLSSQRLQSQAGIRVDEIGLLIKRLSDNNMSMSGTRPCQGHVPDMRSLFLDTVMNIMTRMIFGKRYYGTSTTDEVCQETGRRLRQLLYDTVRQLNVDAHSDSFSCVRWLDRKVEREFEEFCERRVEVLSELVEEHRARWKEHETRLKSSDEKPFVQVLLELQESDPDYYKDWVIQSIMVDLLVAGSDTSASTMDWTFSLLLNNPEVMKKAQIEIDDHVGYERFVDEEDLSHLPYLRCIINEAMRMYPAIPFLLPRESSKECVVGGYDIPSGTMLQINIYALQNDPKLWDDPTCFRPERFLGVEGHRIGYKMMPFGSGRRNCPGEGLAKRVVGVIIGSLLQCFEWGRIEDHKFIDMTTSDSFNLVRAKPLEAKVQPRQVMLKLLHNL